MGERQPLVPIVYGHGSNKPAIANRIVLAIATAAVIAVVGVSGKLTLDSINAKNEVASLAAQEKLVGEDAFVNPSKFVPSGDNWKSRSDVIAMAKLKPDFGNLDEEAKRAKFDAFIAEHNREYESEEEKSYRYAKFKENLDFIDALNKYNPLALFDITDSADFTSEERQRRRMTPEWANYENIKAGLPQDMVYAASKSPSEVLGKTFAAPLPKSSPKGLFSSLENGSVEEEEAYRRLSMSQGEVAWGSESDCAACSRFPSFSDYSSSNRPTNFDWRALGAVTSVKNQKYCGSCWTFSTAQDIEGVHFLAGHDLVSLSEQQLVACDVANDGCDGGYMYAAMQYVTAIGGLVSSDAYPYKGVMMTYDLPTPTCDTGTINEFVESRSNDLGHIEGYQMVAMGAEYEDFMATFMLKNGPLSIAINANGMDYYVHGIVGCETIAGSEYCEAGTIADTTPCDPTALDHGVLLTAYGEQDGIEYWMIKNSWAETWGDKGYYRLIRGCNHCGVSNFAVHSVFKQTLKR